MDDVLPVVLHSDAKQYTLYGGLGYNDLIYLKVTFQGTSLTSYQEAYNKGMSTARVTLEWMFKEIKLYWTTVGFKRKLKIAESPVSTV